MFLIIGVLLGVLLTAVFLRMTRSAKPDSALGKARAVINGGGGPDPKTP